MIRSRFPGIRKAPSLPREQQDIQSHANQILTGLLSIPFLDGVLVQNVALSTSPTVVTHPLGRAAKGIPLVLQSTAPVAVCDTPSARTSASSTLTASAAATASLWFY